MLTQILVTIAIILLIVAIVLLAKYLVVAYDVKRSIKLVETVKKFMTALHQQRDSNERLIALEEKYISAMEEYKAIKGQLDDLRTVEIKTLTKEQAEDVMELAYMETPSGFHIGLDWSYIDQVGDFKITLPTGEVIDTAKYNPQTDEGNDVQN